MVTLLKVLFEDITNVIIIIVYGCLKWFIGPILMHLEEKPWTNMLITVIATKII